MHKEISKETHWHLKPVYFVCGTQFSSLGFMAYRVEGLDSAAQHPEIHANTLASEYIPGLQME